MTPASLTTGTPVIVDGLWLVAWEDVHQDPNLSRALARVLMTPLSLASHVYNAFWFVFNYVLQASQRIVVYVGVRNVNSIDYCACLYTNCEIAFIVHIFNIIWRCVYQLHWVTATLYLCSCVYTRNKNHFKASFGMKFSLKYDMTTQVLRVETWKHWNMKPYINFQLRKWV
jgi:hypothetical protein